MGGPVYIAGPTASGKSALALILAERLGGEIISVDSMQVYRGLDIGTAKATLEERARVPHHLLDILDLHEEFDVAEFLRRARAAEGEVLARGRVPIYCGGTGLYFNALAAGIGSGPPADPELRASLKAKPLTELLAELEHADPSTFAMIDRANPRRVVRALEVIRLTGKPFSLQKQSWERTPPDGLWIGLERAREELNPRINQRVDAMFSEGLVDETRELLARGLEENQTAMQAIGYRQVVEHLRGERDLPATIELVKQRTRQFAKRQMTWFRRQLTLTWVPVMPSTSAETLADEVERLVQP